MSKLLLDEANAFEALAKSKRLQAARLQEQTEQSGSPPPGSAAPAFASSSSSSGPHDSTNKRRRKHSEVQQQHRRHTTETMVALERMVEKLRLKARLCGAVVQAEPEERPTRTKGKPKASKEELLIWLGREYDRLLGLITDSGHCLHEPVLDGPTSATQLHLSPGPVPPTPPSLPAPCEMSASPAPATEFPLWGMFDDADPDQRV